MLLPVDEAYAFDYLSILMTKNKKRGLDPLEKPAAAYISSFKSQKENTQEVLDSEEFDNLLKANEEVFELVDLAKEDRVSAKKVERGNMKRYLAKKALQERFYPNEDITEIKL